MRPLGMFAIVATIFGLVIWWQIYKFHDCKNVGHSTLYCIMDFGK